MAVKLEILSQQQDNLIILDSIKLLGAVQHQMTKIFFSSLMLCIEFWLVMCCTYLDQNFLTGKNLRFSRQARLSAGCILIRSSKMTSNKIMCTTECNNFDPLLLRFFSGWFTWVANGDPTIIIKYIKRSSWEKLEGWSTQWAGLLWRPSCARSSCLGGFAWSSDKRSLKQYSQDTWDQ